jgi:hypothetical protein
MGRQRFWSILHGLVIVRKGFTLVAVEWEWEFTHLSPSSVHTLHAGQIVPPVYPIPPPETN